MPHFKADEVDREISYLPCRPNISDGRRGGERPSLLTPGARGKVTRELGCSHAHHGTTITSITFRLLREKTTPLLSLCSRWGSIYRSRRMGCTTYRPLWDNSTLRLSNDPAKARRFVGDGESADRLPSPPITKTQAMSDLVFPRMPRRRT